MFEVALQMLFYFSVLDWTLIGHSLARTYVPHSRVTERDKKQSEHISTETNGDVSE